jgi:hypothetical protein
LGHALWSDWDRDRFDVGNLGEAAIVAHAN